MRLRASLPVAALAVLLSSLLGAQAQSVMPAAPAEAQVEAQTVTVSTPSTEPETVDLTGEADIEPAPQPAGAIELVDMVIEGELTSVRSREMSDETRQYDLVDVAKALRSRVETKDSFLGYHRFQDGAFMSIDMSDGKVRSNKIVLGKLPDFAPREVADSWIDLNAIVVMTGTHASEDEQGRTVLTLDKQLRPQFGLELWVSGAPVDSFGNEARTIGPVLLVPLQPVVEALGHRMSTDGATVTVRRTQDQAEIQLELATGLVTVNGAPRGVAPDMQFAERDTLLLPFSAVETLTGTHIKLKPGSNRVLVNLDDRLNSTALPGGAVTDEMRDTPFTPESLRFEITDRGPIKGEFTAHGGKYNTRTRVETNGGLQNFASSQPSWASVDIQSLEGWAATVGDYNTTYRELAGVGEARLRGGSWRTQKPSGTIVAIAAGVPLSGAQIESSTVAVPEFDGFVAGARVISKDQSQDFGIAGSLEPDGETGRVVVGGQKRFDMRDNETGLRSAYVSGEVGMFSGEEDGADVRVRANANYAVNDQVGLTATTSYDGEKFVSGAGRSAFADVFDQRVGAITVAAGSAYWRSAEPWGVLNQVSVGTTASVRHQGGETDTTTTSLAASMNTQLGESGPNVSLALTNTTEDQPGIEIESTNLRVRALQRFDWGTLTANYTRTTSDIAATSEQLVATLFANPVRRSFSNDANFTLAPTATVDWDGETTNLRVGASLAGDSGRALGDRFSVTGRVSALSDFDAETGGTRYYSNLQAKYRVTRNVELATIYTNDLRGYADFSIALRGVINFNEPRRHRLPDAGKGVLTGRVFLDRNRDGVRQEDEPGIGGVRVSVRGTGLGLNASRSGQFTIQNIKQGLYEVAVNKRSLPLGYMVAESAEPRVTIGEGRRTDVDIPVILSGQVRGAVFVDANANGAIDPGEQRLEGQWVRLVPLSGGEPVVIQSATFGQYGFESVAPGQYRLEAMVSGSPVRLEIEISDEAPFLKVPIPVPPNLLDAGSGPDLMARVMGEA